MSFWSWFKDVLTDVGEHEPVPIHLEREGEDAYAFRLGLRAGFRGHETARIPIGRRPNPAPHPILDLQILIPPRLVKLPVHIKDRRPVIHQPALHLS